MKQTVFVTGAAGFIGSYVARTLADRGVQVIGLDRSPLMEASIHAWGIKAFICGPCDRKHLVQAREYYGVPNAIIHCAGSGSVAASFENPLADFQANVWAALEVLEFARCEGRVTVVMPSSAAVYGETPSFPQREDMPLYPVSPYGAHKVILEELGRSYARNFKLPVAIVRLFSVYGVGLRKQLLWDACCKACSDNFIFIGTGEEQRDWLHVTDAARLLVLAASKASSACPIVNGGTGQGTSIRNILTQLGALWQPSLFPEFSGGQRQGDPAHYVADTTMLQSWEFVPKTNMAAALAAYIEWFRKERPL